MPSYCENTKTRMKTSISNEALFQSGAEKIMFPPKPDRQTYRWTDICIYRVALQLKSRKLVKYCKKGI